MSIEAAELDWNGALPIHVDYQDSYYSDGDGFEESQHVFLAGNQLQERAEKAAFPHVICETGFGTGLNFLALLKMLEFKPNASEIDSDILRGTSLEFYSVEKFPLTAEQLSKAHAPWPCLESVSRELQQQLPKVEAGWHQLDFLSGRVKLKLFYGDVQDWCSQLFVQSVKPQAWFLDGFAPSKNLDMWCDRLFDTMANTSTTGTTFSTFTSAGFVRRALRDRGFQVQKTQGYGKKRDMLCGCWP
jgi:tRNA 5-methylaminomethyl-2-thiouridine biosynthesis bifunctional protein